MHNIKTSSALIDNGRFGQYEITFETGRLAKQAAGSVLLTFDGSTSLLSAATVSKEPKEGYDFFPLTVDVEERMYAAGKIPGSFFRREGRAATEAILASRLIDRPIRPSFSDDLRNEIQLCVTVMSIAPDVYYDALSINAASASLAVAGLPFAGPIAGVRIALIEGQWVCFPNAGQMQKAVFNMAVAGRKIFKNGKEDIAIMMLEAGATDNALDLISEGAIAPDEQVVAGGLEAAKPFIKELCEAQEKLKAQAEAKASDFQLFPPYTQEVYDIIDKRYGDKIRNIYLLQSKLERVDAENSLKTLIKEELLDEIGEENLSQISPAFKSIAKKFVRGRILNDNIRIDGRGLRDIRQLSADINILPRVHGSALFDRGETQVLGVTTLNNLKLAQSLDSLHPELSRRYMHHYNFPPYSTGEVGRVGSPKRREIGHGALAERALKAVLPDEIEFPYAIRQVSEAIGSNGSTSMASVCASTISLLSAGVPLKDKVAGIACGLITEGDKWAVLTDILGDEDALGDMDFKVAGTEEIITAIQLDTKLDGIDSEILASALNQAKEARLKILEVLNAAIDKPAELNNFVPRITKIQIPVSKIGEIIGPKGATITKIQEDTGAEISIEDDGTVYISSQLGDSAKAAEEAINRIANPPKLNVGDRFEGEVASVVSFGAFVSLNGIRDGLLHISQLKGLNNGQRVENAEDVLEAGQKINVEISKIDDKGKISLILFES